MAARPVITKSVPLGFPWGTEDPFLFCVFHEDFYPKGNKFLAPDEPLINRNLGSDFTLKNGYRMYHGETVPGFPGHPHRGFETITVVNKGWVDHADSLGASGRYGNGDTQWMTAGRGIQHSEMFPCLNQDTDNQLELFQIWLNLPAVKKFAEPHYKMLWKDTVPKYNETDAQGKVTNVQVIAGNLNGQTPPAAPPDSWASDKNHDVMVVVFGMEAGATWTLPAATQKQANRVVYFFKGTKATFNGQEVKPNLAHHVKADQSINIVNIGEPLRMLVLQGVPINEPVVQHGPFVMNTQEQISQAFSDYRKTQFGGWPWPESDPNFGLTRGRFAEYADGSLEEPDRDASEAK